jgi:hypothetical protein
MQKASEHTLLDLCVLHMHDIQLQQLYIRYWSWNYTDVSGFQIFFYSFSHVQECAHLNF